MQSIPKYTRDLPRSPKTRALLLRPWSGKWCLWPKNSMKNAMWSWPATSRLIGYSRETRSLCGAAEIAATWPKARKRRPCARHVRIPRRILSCWAKTGNKFRARGLENSRVRGCLRFISKQQHPRFQASSYPANQDWRVSVPLALLRSSTVSNKALAADGLQLRPSLFNTP